MGNMDCRFIVTRRYIMAKLVFLRRTQKEVDLFGGEVFIDIDGKNVGILSMSNQTMELAAGSHTIRMYKSHTYDTYIGFVEQTITLVDDEALLVRYSCPLMVSKPGSMIITDYSVEKETELIESKDNKIQKDLEIQETEKKIAKDNYNKGVWIIIGIAFVVGVIYFIEMITIDSYLI